MERINLGHIEIPKNYIKFTKAQRDIVCDNMIDKLLIYLDRHLQPDINRIEFLDDIFESTIQTNLINENYEVAALIRDCRQKLHED